MNILNNMNAKLAQQYKLTDMSCETCNGVTMGKHGLPQIYCPKCDKNYDIKQQTLEEEINSDEEFEKYYQEAGLSTQKNTQLNQQEEAMEPHLQSVDSVEDKYEEFLSYYNEMEKKKKYGSDEVSKKIGAKLINGWRMLEQSCQNCNVPLMEDKSTGAKICCGCDKNYADKPKMTKKQQRPQTKAKEHTSKETKPATDKRVQSIQRETVPITSNPTQIKCGSKSSTIYDLTGMKNRSLYFLEQRLDKAMEDNNLSQFQKIIDLIGKIQNM